ncbi:MAG: ISL3 family transposase [Bacilli bacterium]
MRQSVKINKPYMEDDVLYVCLSLIDSRPACPLCQCTNVHRHGHVTKKMTHSVINHSKCIILYKAKRYKCITCGRTFLEHNPLSSVNDSISTYTKIEILHALRNHNNTFTHVASQFNVSIQKVSDIFDHHVQCKRLSLPEIMCIDEIYTARISSYKYACVLLDFKTNQIIDIIPTRHKNYLRYYFGTLNRNAIMNVKTVIMDMYEPYRDTIQSVIPKALICIDSFHVIRQLNEAMKRIRIDVMNTFKKKNKTFEHNDDRYYMLKKFHYFFVKDFERIYKGPINIPKFKARWNKYDILHYLLTIDNDLRNAYYLKEAYREFNLTASIHDKDERVSTERAFLELVHAFRNSVHEGFRAFGETLSNWQGEILNSFIGTENGRRLSNGPIEGMNSKIKTLIKISNGMRNFKRFRNRCMYALNKNMPIK